MSGRKVSSGLIRQPVGRRQGKFLVSQPPQGSVRTALIVVTTPAFDDHDLRLPQRVEGFAIEQLVEQPGIKLSMNRSPNDCPARCRRSLLRRRRREPDARRRRHRRNAQRRRGGALKEARCLAQRHCRRRRSGRREVVIAQSRSGEAAPIKDLGRVGLNQLHPPEKSYKTHLRPHALPGVSSVVRHSPTLKLARDRTSRLS